MKKEHDPWREAAKEVMENLIFRWNRAINWIKTKVFGAQKSEL